MIKNQFFDDFFKEFCLTFGMEYSFSILMKAIKKTIPANYIACTHYQKDTKKISTIYEFSDPPVSLPLVNFGDEWITFLENYLVPLESDIDLKVYLVPDVKCDEKFYNFFINKDHLNRSLLIIELYSDAKFCYFLGLRALSSHSFNLEHTDIFTYLKNPILDIVQMLFVNNQQINKNISNNIITTSATELLKQCPALTMIVKQIEEVAPVNINVLVYGETGVGKEIVAEAIHESSKRKGGAYVKVNCASIPESLLEAQLFGYEKGSFTGAINSHKGYFEQANGGTLYLDEIGELSLAAQVSLLRIIESKEVQRLGSQQRYLLNFRLICATNRDLQKMVENGSFRADLWYRINGYTIKIPTLRQRKEDISVLLHYFCRCCATEMGMDYLPQITPDLIRRLILYPWHGNVRELRNWIERALLHTLTMKSQILLVPKEESSSEETKINLMQNINSISDPLSLEEMTRYYILWAIKQCNGRLQGPSSVSELLKIKPSTLRSRMEKLKIDFPKQKKV